MARFPISKPDRQYVKKLNCIIDICGVNYLCTVTQHKQPRFRKKTGFSYINNIHIIEIITF